MQMCAYLHEEKQVGILALGGGAVTLLDVVGGDVDTLHNTVSGFAGTTDYDELTILLVGRIWCLGLLGVSE
jgi:hypothetical protein